MTKAKRTSSTPSDAERQRQHGETMREIEELRATIDSDVQHTRYFDMGWLKERKTRAPRDRTRRLMQAFKCYPDKKYPTIKIIVADMADYWAKRKWDDPPDRHAIRQFLKALKTA